MKYLKYLFVLLAASLLAACGGGGGSAGTSSSGSSGSTTTATLVVTLTDSSGVALATPHTIKAGQYYFAQATALDASGKPIANQVITFSTDATLVTLAATSALTDATGVASVKMTPLSVAGAGSVGASMSYTASGATTASTITGTAATYQVTPSAATGIPTLSLTLTDSSGVALSTPRTFVTGSSYRAKVTVLDATSAPISNLVVTFTTDSTLATISPASALTDSNGVATVQIVPLTKTGAGSVQVAGVVNGTSYTSSAVSYQVASASVAASLAFVPQTATTANPTPGIIVVSNASNGNKLLTATFQLSNSQGVGISGQSLLLSLNAQSISAGVTFLVNGISTNSAQTLVTDQGGQVSISVVSGTLPTPILVTATLASNSLISASSYGLAVTNGRPTQLRSSIASSVLSVEASAGGTSIIQGVQATLTVLLSDRMGNPIPAGTTVNLIASHGQVQGTCTIAIVNNASQCSAVWTSGASRPDNGFFTVLAYLDGEEDFVDANGNNQYDSGEAFYDMGQAFLPKTIVSGVKPSDYVYNSATDQPIAGGMTGTSACAVTNLTPMPYQIANTCDGVWSSSTRVRLGVAMNWAGNVAKLTATNTSGSTSTYGDASKMVIRVSDDKGNAMPSGSALSAALTCPDTVTKVPGVSLSLAKTLDTIYAIDLTVTYTFALTLPTSGATGCSLKVTVTTPAGVVTSVSFPTV